VPHLDLPVRVGLAFVPSGDANVEGLSEVHKAELLAQVKQAFSNREFIADIQIIPEAYLRSARGFDTVDQVARLYQLAVIALVSYDQAITISEGGKSGSSDPLLVAVLVILLWASLRRVRART
jgi:rhombotail lipoprotein